MICAWRSGVFIATSANFRRLATSFVAAGEIKPDSVRAWNEAASVFVMAEQYPQALAALDKVRALNAKSREIFTIAPWSMTNCGR